MTRVRDQRMQQLYPRLIGGFGLVWAVVLQRGALDWSSDVLWASFAVAWVVTSVALVLGRRTAVAGLAIAVLSFLLFLGPGRKLYDALALFVWLGLAIAVTDRRPLERALLVRVTVSAAYGFACLAKLNPSFLSGEQVMALASDRSQLNAFESLLRTNVGVIVAWATVIGEGTLAVALWFRRTRVPAAIGGAAMSLIFIYAAHNGTVWDVAYIIVLTLLLVASYLAFFCPIRPPDPVADEPAVDAATGTST
jgi:hypothetical protein